VNNTYSIYIRANGFWDNYNFPRQYWKRYKILCGNTPKEAIINDLKNDPHFNKEFMTLNGWSFAYEMPDKSVVVITS